MKLALCLSGCLLLHGCFFLENKKNSAKNLTDLQEIRGEVFGSYYIIKYVGSLDQVRFNEDLQTFFKGFNSEFSTYHDDSLISRFNNSRAHLKFKTTQRFIDMLKIAEELNRKSLGSFDPTLAPVIKLWGFGGGKSKGVPSEASLKEAMSKVGFRFIHWDEKTFEVWKSREGVALDVNAFAPGWAADLIGDLLSQHQVKSYMVDISGEILIKGEKAPGRPWIIGIERPSKEHAKGIQVALRVKDLSVATSGDYRQYFNDKGHRRSHIIDPRTGRPVEHKISSATVIAASALDADAWGTVMMVLGEKGITLAEEHGIKAYLLEALEDSEFRVIVSPLMETFMREAAL